VVGRRGAGVLRAKGWAVADGERGKERC